MQGGGAGIASGGSANFTDCIIHDNKANFVRARILELLEPFSSAPLERYVTDCILLHAGRWGVHLRICQLRQLRFVWQRGKRQRACSLLTPLDPSSSAPLNSDTCAVFTRRPGLVLAFEPSGPFFQRPAGTLHD